MICIACKIEKNESEFYVRAGRNTLFEACASCLKQRAKDSYNRRMENDPIRFKGMMMLKSAKTRAKSRGMDFNITLEDVVCTPECPVTGVVFDYSAKGKPTPYSPSLDRIDSSKGYVKGNVQVVSYFINTLKNDVSFKDIEAIYLYMKGNQ